MSEPDDLVKEALIEGLEGLEQMERDLSALERDPASREALGSVFRTLHSIKGIWSTLGFEKLAAIAHGGENLLSSLRDGAVEFDGEVSNALFLTADTLGRMMTSVESIGHEGDADFADLVQRLSSLGARGRRAPGGASAPAPPRPDAPPRQDARPAPPEPRVRVEPSLLDEFGDIAEEIRFATGRILGFTATRTDKALFRATRHLERLSLRLSEVSRRARRRPLGTLFERIPGWVRRLSTACGKEVRVELLGGEIEVDAFVIQSLKDPLNQIVRNAIDHGIEPAEVRIRSGKPREGRVSVSATRTDGEIRLEVTDDGAGIDLPRVLAKAREMGLADEARLASLCDDEIAAFVFCPGLTTRSSASGLSGRGVGLDVVRTQATRIGGTAFARSRRGLGTTIGIRVPTLLKT